MKRHSLFAIVTFVVAFIFISCKPKNNPSPQDNLIGKWKALVTVADANGNGKWDAGDAIDSVNSPALMQFNTGGSGAILMSGVTVSQFSWAYGDNKTYLQVTLTATPVTTRHIDTLTSSMLVLKDTTGISAFWQVFIKQ